MDNSPVTSCLVIIVGTGSNLSGEEEGGDATREAAFESSAGGICSIELEGGWAKLRRSPTAGMSKSIAGKISVMVTPSMSHHSE